MIGLPSVSLRKLLEVGGQPPGQLAVAADDAVLGDRDDEGDSDLAGHTATSALMCGCGSYPVSVKSSNVKSKIDLHVRIDLACAGSGAAVSVASCSVGLLEVIQIEMRVTECVHEFAELAVRHLRHHQSSAARSWRC